MLNWTVIMFNGAVSYFEIWVEVNNALIEARFHSGSWRSESLVNIEQNHCAYFFFKTLVWRNKNTPLHPKKTQIVGSEPCPAGLLQVQTQSRFVIK